MHSTYSVASRNKVTLLSGAWLYGFHRRCVETAAVSRGASHVTIKQRCNHFGGYSERAVQSYSHSLRVTYRGLRAQWVCSEAVNSALVVIVKRFSSGEALDECVRACVCVCVCVRDVEGG